MQNIFHRFRFIPILLIGLLWTSQVQAQIKTWEFRSWDSTITIETDSSIIVDEQQDIDFHGAFTWVGRTLPKTKGIWYDEIEVYDQDGKAFASSDVDIQNTSKEVRIRAYFSKTPDAGITQKSITFHYRAHNAIGDFADHDELYWNVVSAQRGVPIHYASAKVVLPKSYGSEDTQQRLLVGPRGSTADRTTYTQEGDTLTFTTSDVGPSDEMTIVAGWPKGEVTFETIKEETSLWSSFWDWFRWIYIASPLVLLLWLISRWRAHGRDPEGRVTIIPQYEAPDGAPPAVVGTLIDEQADRRDFIATIIDLAVRGYLRIEEDEEGGLFKKKEYTFVRLKSVAHDTSLKPYELLLMEKLFSTGERVALSDLKNSFYKDMKEITSSIYSVTTDEYGYFPVRPDSIRRRYYYVAIALIPIGFFTLFVPWVYALLLVIFGRVMPKKTKKGIHALEWSEGFKLYLHTAERFRVAAMTPQTFERFLPYAMVFNVEKQWANRFRDIYTEPPKWFHSTHPLAAFNAVSFTDHLVSVMNSSVATSLASSPSSSSGFGGGGFAGGGGGGGGSSAG
ncbi:MAG: DUF2207 domain-containing protein [Candidatus Nomurabacteria bacterium]|nr:MAG: DUF2207 domain-containing protein [Candidatus Nomurabacteria bacterium]